MYENTKLKRKDLIYPDSTYQIVGILFNVGKTVGFGHKENFYQKAVAMALQENKISSKEQLPIRLNYKGKFIGTYYLDFPIEEKLILEIKAKRYFSKKDIEQVYNYLKANNLKLGILAYFTKSSVRFKRIVNLH